MRSGRGGDCLVEGAGDRRRAAVLVLVVVVEMGSASTCLASMSAPTGLLLDLFIPAECANYL
jgi:hypothetical protein